MAKSVVNETIEDKVVLVTGGAAGVGAAVVRTLLGENARVCFFTINFFLQYQCTLLHKHYTHRK